LIRLSKLADYGVVLMIFLADHREQESWSARELSDEVRLPLPTVSKLLRKLAAARILSSRRGVRGGYRLARGAEDISLADILLAIEGPMAVTDCTADDGKRCEHEDGCSARSTWGQVNQRILNSLREVKLAEMGGKLLLGMARSNRNHGEEARK
jgi:FeS assembly SUF system regulator